MNKAILIPVIALVFLAIDFYAFQVVKTIGPSLNETLRKVVTVIYWSVSAFVIVAFLLYNVLPVDKIPRIARAFVLVAVFANFISKLLLVIFLFVEDLTRLLRWIFQMVSHYFNPVESGAVTDSIPRSQFLSTVALTVGAVPTAAMAYGIISGAHDYRVRRVTIALPDLPKAFDGMTIGQLSDIHSGSFFNKRAVQGGVDMLMKEKPELILFTGDLVNNIADEVRDYVPMFSKINAPMGVHSTLGNHDYGDYVQWATEDAKRANLNRLKLAHKEMGWDLMNNEHRYLKIGNERIALLGIENFGAKGHFPKYGKLALANKDVEAPVKILMSHDPSHWDYEVNQKYKDIDLMLAGHTHGFQFGVETEHFKWSPVQYMYKQWGGLYQEGKQYLYVNRGFGYLGFPGRVGMPPEITILTLKSV